MESTTDSPGFEITVTKWYIQLTYTRQPTPEDMKAANDRLIQIHDQEGVSNLLCDVRKMTGDVPIRTQIEGVKLLWQLRDFQKFAFIINDKDLEKLLASSFMNMRFMHKFRAFADENSAIKWLRSEEE